jgi:hypothetical protein
VIFFHCEILPQQPLPWAPEPILRSRVTTPRVAQRVLKTKILSSTMKNAVAYNNVGVVVAP